MNFKVRFLTRTALLLALTLVIQLLRLPQPITGTGVNFFLYIAVFMIGISSGSLIGLLTPIIALSFGIIGFAPLVPFIVVGNLSLVVVFGLIKNKNRYLAVIMASAVKFLVLVIAVNLIIQVPPKAAQMMQLPQLFTALGGGALAIVINLLLERTKVFSEVDKQA